MLVDILKRATEYRAFLRKMTYEDKASCDSTPPCISGDELNAGRYSQKSASAYLYLHIYLSTYVVSLIVAACRCVLSVETD